MARLRSGPVTRAALVLALLVLGVVASSARADTKANCGRPATGWSKVNLPKFSGGASYGGVTVSTSSSSQSWLVDPDDASVMLATDGSEIMRSANGGCTWDTVFTVTGALAGTDADAPAVAMPYVVGRLVAPDDAPGSKRFYALLLPGSGPGIAGAFSIEPPMLVAVTDDAGRTWAITPPGPGLASSPRCQYLMWAAVSSRDPRVLEVICQPGLIDGFTGYEALRSTDAGATWTPFKLPTGWFGFSGGTIVADPQHRLGLWAIFTDSSTPSIRVVLVHSVDGEHWSAPTTVLPRFHAGIDFSSYGMDIRPGPKTGSVRLIVWAGVEGVVESADGGVHWHRIGAVPSPAGVVQGRAPGLVDARYLANGDVLTIGVYGVNCQKGSHAVVTQYRGPYRRGDRLPNPPKAWGAALGSASGVQSAGRVKASIFGNITTGSAAAPCGPAYPAGYRSPGNG